MIQIEATPDEIKALANLINRTPMSPGEALFIDALFDRWAATFKAAHDAANQTPDPNSDNEKPPA